MAFVAGDYRFSVAGVLGSGEMFINRWAVKGVAGPTERQAAADALRDLYVVIFGGDISSSCEARTCQARNLFTDTVTDLDWDTVIGDQLDNLIPTQLAIRISLNSQTNVNGGPFISGWAPSAVTEGPTLPLAEAQDIRDGVVALAAALDADGMTLGIERPTTSEVVVADRVRVGLRFDVIRKRANELPESYATADLTP